jgi:hypothetical protein
MDNSRFSLEEGRAERCYLFRFLFSFALVSPSLLSHWDGDNFSAALPPIICFLVHCSIMIIGALSPTPAVGGGTITPANFAKLIGSILFFAIYLLAIGGASQARLGGVALFCGVLTFAAATWSRKLVTTRLEREQEEGKLRATVEDMGQRTLALEKRDTDNAKAIAMLLNIVRQKFPDFDFAHPLEDEALSGYQQKTKGLRARDALSKGLDIDAEGNNASP